MENDTNVGINDAAMAVVQNNGDVRVATIRAPLTAHGGTTHYDFALGTSGVSLDKFDLKRSETYKMMRPAIYALRFVALFCVRAACNPINKISDAGATKRVS